MSKNRIKEEEQKKAKNQRDKEEKNLTMSHMIFRNYRVLQNNRTSRVFSAKIIQIQDTKPICQNCGSEDVFIYDHVYRKAIVVSIDGRDYHTEIKVRRYKCKSCGEIHREQIKGLKKHKRHSERFKDSIVEMFSQSVSNKKIAEKLNISQSSVERAIHEKLKTKVKEILSYPSPEVIGIDEHTIHKGYKFATTICDLSHNRIYDVIEGRRRNQVEESLMKYKGRENVKVVFMDLSSGYRNIVRHCFPNAKIVADRFHVIRMITYHFMEFCKQKQEEIKWNRKLTYPLRTKREKLKPEAKVRLEEFFKSNPIIELAYNFKEDLCKLLNKKTQTFKECLRNLRELKEMMRIMTENAPEEFKKIAKTINEWYIPIIRMWRFSKNNSITEGFHRKMKLIQRMAYGFRNFENYRLRVLVLCGVKNFVTHRLWC